MSAMASQIRSHTIVYSTVYSRRRSKKTSNLRVTGLCEGNSTVTGEFPAQMASNAEIVSTWLRHHGLQATTSVRESWQKGSRQAQADYSEDTEQAPVVKTMHYNDVIMGTMGSQLTILTIVYSAVYPSEDEGNIKALRPWPLSGKFTGDRWIPRKKGQWSGKYFHLMTSSWAGGEQWAQQQSRTTWIQRHPIHNNRVNWMTHQMTSPVVVYIYYPTKTTAFVPFSCQQLYTYSNTPSIRNKRQQQWII